MRRLKALFIAIAAMTMAINASAQNCDKQKMSREQMAEAQAKHIAKEICVDEKTNAKFVETYVNYKKELWGTAPKCKKGDKKKSETEEQAEQKMQQKFERSQKMLDIRTKYYKEFSKFLTQRQIEKMYDKERKMMQRLKQRHDEKQQDGKQHNHDGKGKRFNNQQK